MATSSSNIYVVGSLTFRPFPHQIRDLNIESFIDGTCQTQSGPYLVFPSAPVLRQKFLGCAIQDLLIPQLPGHRVCQAVLSIRRELHLRETCGYLACAYGQTQTHIPRSFSPNMPVRTLFSFPRTLSRGCINEHNITKE